MPVIHDCLRNDLIRVGRAAVGSDWTSLPRREVVSARSLTLGVPGQPGLHRPSTTCKRATPVGLEDLSREDLSPERESAKLVQGFNFALPLKQLRAQ